MLICAPSRCYALLYGGSVWNWKIAGREAVELARKVDKVHMDNDTGVACLSLIARYHQLATDPAQLRYQFAEAEKPFTDRELLRAAKALGFKARQENLATDRLASSLLPVIACDLEGRYFIIAKVAEAKTAAEEYGEEGVGERRYLIQDPLQASPETLTETQLRARWAGDTILLTRRGGLLSAVREFDITWFIPSLIKYRALFGDVLLASFFLQLFALVTPLFFQVVMDKVLVHKGLTTLDVKPGEVIGIVGRSGSGKSTLTKMVQRFYVPEAGRVLIDGVDLGLVDTAWLRRSIGVVLQENFLFNRSIRENIALANTGLPMERVVAAARLAGAHEFILTLPEGYDTLVGEQGSNLSGGQRQRLAIARALITSPRILIFDEATSALDYESERIIQENMAAICKGRTVFIIAHRLSTVRQCDRILVMEQGRIVESGSHQQLLEHNGYYARLHSYQSHSPNIKPVASAPVVT